MKCQNFALIFFSFLFVITEVAPWTIDLPEVRRYLFEKEKYEKDNKISKNEYEDYVHSDKSFYSNIQGNSMHNSEGHHDDHEKYAEEFGHQSYMEKKVQEIVKDGSRYLEGLRRSLEDYSRYLEECNRRNMSNFSNSSSSNSSWSPPLSPSGSNMTMRYSSDERFRDLNPADFIGRALGSTGMNTSSIMSGMNISGVNMTWMNSSSWLNMSSSTVRMSCREATEKSENIRRYAALATWATKRLQDIAYAGKYQKIDQYEENELILKLAWFLDRLALLTGYEPDYKHYLEQRTTTATTPAPLPMTLVPQTQEIVNYLIHCVKANSTVPATVRCQYPLPLPDMVSQIVGATSTESSQQEGTDVLPMSPQDSSAQQSLELLVTSENYMNPRKITKRSPTPDEYYVPIPIHEKPKPIVEFFVKKLTNLKEIVKSVKKHAVADFASQIAVHKHLHKRSIDDDTTLLANRLSNDSKPIVKLDKPVAETAPIHLPVLDVSVINTKSFKKRSIDDNSMYSNLINRLSNRKPTANFKKSTKSVIKRSAENPFSKLANYYIKYKVWDSSNPSHKKNNEIATFDVNNHLQQSKISKRSLFYKKHRHFLFPKLQKIHSNRHKHEKFHSAKKGKGKFLSYVENMLEKKHRKFEKKHKIIKRSLIYEHMYLPRISANPQGDISYYVKNKKGRDYNPSLTQAAQVRLGLQQVFETGNIVVIHRFGSNYNPLNPAPFYAGVLKGMADS